MKNLFLVVTVIVMCMPLKSIIAQTPFPYSVKNVRITSDAAEEEDLLMWGYCGESIDVEMGVGVNMSLSAAICLPVTKFGQFAGNQIRTVRIGFGAAATQTTIFIAESLTGKKLYEQSVGGCRKGWNTIELTTPFDIPESDFYVGYTAKGNNHIGLSGEANEDGCWLAYKGEWDNAFQNGWGSVCIQVGIGGDHMPQFDLAITKFYPEFKMSSQEGVTVIAEIANKAIQTVTSYDITCKIGDKEAVTETVHTILKRGTSEIYKTRLLAEGLSKFNPITVKVSNINGSETDANENNNVAETQVYIYKEAYPRKTLLEHFTTEKCSYCPGGAKTLTKAVDRNPNIIWVSHHVGYGVDEFTIKESNSYLPFYGSLNGAPMFMTDRTRMSNCPTEYPVTPIHTDYNIVATNLNEALSIPAFIKLDIESEYHTDAQEINVTVSGEAFADFFEFEDSALVTVFLTEDSIKAIAQAGAGGSYIHNHLIRAVLSDVYGTPIEFDGNTFSQTFTGKIDSKWNLDNLNVIAFVNGMGLNSAGEIDYINSPVYNAEIKLSPSIIADIQPINKREEVYVYPEDGKIKVNGEYESLNVYTLGGNEVLNECLSSGIYLVKVIRADKVTVKKVVMK